MGEDMYDPSSDPGPYYFHGYGHGHGVGIIFAIVAIVIGVLLALIGQWGGLILIPLSPFVGAFGDSIGKDIRCERCPGK